MQIANYGSALCVSGDLTKLGATQFYALISSLGTMGMMLVLPVLGKLTAILGQRTTILMGVCIQLIGHLLSGCRRGARDERRLHQSVCDRICICLHRPACRPEGLPLYSGRNRSCRASVSGKENSIIVL